MLQGVHGEYMQIFVTCLCILAVDFKIFPLRYAKTETYGTSLMDLGVGLFVVVNSSVSRQARDILARNWINALLSTCPLTVLGFARLISTRGVSIRFMWENMECTGISFSLLLVWRS